MSEQILKAGLDTSATIDLLRQAASLAKYSWPFSTRNSKPYFVQGVLIAPDTSDYARPLMVIDLATEDRREWASEKHSPARTEPRKPNGPVYKRHFRAAVPQPTTFLRHATNELAPLLDAHRKAHIIDDGVLALEALSAAVQETQHPIAGVWYARSKQPDIHYEGREGYASQSSLHIQHACEPGAREGEIIMEALLGNQVIDGISHRPVRREDGRISPREYTLTVGFGALAEARHHFEATVGVTTIPPAVPAMRL